MFSKVVVKNEKVTETDVSSSIKTETGNEFTTSTKDEKNDKFKINEDNDDETSNKLRLILRGLSQFVNAHHPIKGETNCKLLKKRIKNESNDANDSSTELCDDKSTNLINEIKDEDLNIFNSLPTNEWKIDELILFVAALQACFRNFSSVKKEFLPWKSSKSIIELYHLCLNQQDETLANRLDDNETQDNEDERIKKLNDLRNKLDERSMNGKDVKLKECSADLNDIIVELIRLNKDNSALRESNKKTSTIIDQNDKDDDSNGNSSMNSSISNLRKKSTTTNLRTSSRTNSKKSTNSSTDDKKDQNNEKKSKNLTKSDVQSENECLEMRKRFLSNIFKKHFEKYDKEDKNLTNDQSKSEAIDQYEFDDKLEPMDCNSLGSLKFFKDGQLVLKLNAKQSVNNTQPHCKWEESIDSIEMNKLRSNKRKKIESNKLRESFEHKKSIKMSNDDQDNSSFNESDDSRSSCSNYSLQKPLMINLFKKAKVKVENYQLPQLSPAWLKDLKDEKEIDLETNRKSISPSNGDDHLKRKSKIAKNMNSKKKPILKLNECNNQMDMSQIPPNLLLQFNSLTALNQQQNSNSFINQLNFLTSLPLDVRQKFLSIYSNPSNEKLNSDLNVLNNFNNLINNPQQNNDNINKLLASLVQQQQSNALIENFDSIKQNLMNNLNALIENDLNRKFESVK